MNGHYQATVTQILLNYFADVDYWQDTEYITVLGHQTLPHVSIMGETNKL